MVWVRGPPEDVVHLRSPAIPGRLALAADGLGDPGQGEPGQDVAGIPPIQMPGPGDLLGRPRFPAVAHERLVHASFRRRRQVHAGKSSPDVVPLGSRSPCLPPFGP